jgi:ribosomal RNA-processing protein 17
MLREKAIENAAQVEKAYGATVGRIILFCFNH